MNDSELATIAQILREAREILERSESVSAALEAERLKSGTPLSPEERRLLPKVNPDTIEECEESHASALAAAIRSREALIEQMRGGLPVLAPLPNGGGDGLGLLVWSGMKRAIRDYTLRAIALNSAAALLCDVAGYDDDGEEEGVVWEVKL